MPVDLLDNISFTITACASLALIIALILCIAFRDRIKTFSLKKIVKPKHDYRGKWVRLINQLSRPVESDEVYKRAMDAVCDLLSCTGAILWTKRGNSFYPVYKSNIDLNTKDAIEPESSDFCRALEQDEWIYLPRVRNQHLSQHNQQLPKWVAQVKNVWTVIPLTNEGSLVGFMLLCAQNPSEGLSRKDLDLIKTVGRQVGNYLMRHEQSEMLAESRQFETFNKLSAYVMHDLKNLIAQQSLVVKNAEKHRDNPAFVEDAINTIHNSVARMNNLLKKLQQAGPSEVKVLAVKDVLIESVKRSHKSQPIPSLIAIKEDWRIKADFDNIVMVFTHIIQNAQDATKRDGFVDISALLNGEMLDIIVEDNGSGMDYDFIQNRLFKPFETTKSGRGMGIGVYQAKDYVESLGGTVSVNSTVGEGSTFTISLPLLLN